MAKWEMGKCGSEQMVKEGMGKWNSNGQKGKWKGGWGWGWGNGKREMGNGELAKGEKVWEWGMEKGYGNGEKEKWRMSEWGKRDGE